MFSIYDGRDGFCQWDLNQKLVVSAPCEVHFCNGTSDCSLVCETYEQDGKTLVNVPNILLQTAKNIRVYAYVKDNEEQYTKASKVFSVRARTKPDDYVYTETEVRSVESIVENELAKAKESGLLNTLNAPFRVVQNGVGSAYRSTATFRIGEYNTPQEGVVDKEFRIGTKSALGDFTISNPDAEVVYAGGAKGIVRGSALKVDDDCIYFSPRFHLRDASEPKFVKIPDEEEIADLLSKKLDTSGGTLRGSLYYKNKDNQFLRTDNIVSWAIANMDTWTPFFGTFHVCRVQQKNYTGTGVYGEAYKKTLTFDFQPKLIIVKKKDDLSKNGDGSEKVTEFNETMMMAFYGSPSAVSSRYFGTGTVYSYQTHLEWNGKSVSWWGQSETRHLNVKNNTYHVLAIG